MTQKPNRPIGGGKSIKDWDDWPAMLARMEELVASGMDGRAAYLLTGKEFEVERNTLKGAVKRGDVPCIPSPEHARVQARLRGDTLYRGAPCDKCGGRERWVADAVCRECARTYARARKDALRAKQPDASGQ